MNRRVNDDGASTDDPRMLSLLLNVRQAVELLNVSERHFTVLCGKGEIRAVRMGTAWRIGSYPQAEATSVCGYDPNHTQAKVASWLDSVV